MQIQPGHGAALSPGRLVARAGDTSFPSGAPGLGGVPSALRHPRFADFLSVQEWPARETCPDCKKLRVVDREHCEHCGADFAPPEKNGTEMFEPLVAVT